MRVRPALFVLATSWGVACSVSTSAPPAAPKDDGSVGGRAHPADASTPVSVDPGSGGTGGQTVVDAGPSSAPEVTASADAVPPGDAVAGSARVLIYTRTTGFRHDSIPVAADFIGRAAKVAGLTPETSEDTAKFTTAGLAPYEAIILLATTGEPFGPGTVGIDALAAYVKGGGALVGIENATHAYDDSDTYVSLLGGDFAGHPGGFTTATCTKEGDHPSVAMLPPSFNVVDEIYAFTKFRMDNQIVLRCAADHLPVSWYREEGAGRVFYTALGHSNESWMKPPLVDQHVLPGLLWAMRR